MKAWHFVADTLRDGRPVPADGVVLKHDGPVVLCRFGLHASPTPFEALQYAWGPNLCLVECGGQIVTGTGSHNDKLACSERSILVRMDAAPLLREFARMQALSVAHVWDAPSVVLEYLITGDESIRDAARDAARDDAASTAAARATARDAAWAAARAAAWAAARDAAWAASGAAARAAARAAAWAAARDAFNSSVYECFADYMGAKP